jgi:hypothetical protein
MMQWPFPSFRGTLTGLILAAAVAMAAPAMAQPSGDGDLRFAVLDGRLRGGDRVIVTGPAVGQVRGRFAGLSPETLLVETDDGPQRVALTDVAMVRRRRHGILLGTIIGAGVGAGLAIPMNMLLDAEGGEVMWPTIKLVALTTGIGIGIDALIDLPRTVYRRSERPTVQVKPQLVKHAAGVTVQVTF